MTETPESSGPTQAEETYTINLDDFTLDQADAVGRLTEQGVLGHIQAVAYVALTAGSYPPAKLDPEAVNFIRTLKMRQIKIIEDTDLAEDDAEGLAKEAFTSP